MKLFSILLFSASLSSCLSKQTKPEPKTEVPILPGRTSEYYCLKLKSCKSVKGKACGFDPNGNVMLTFPTLCALYDTNCNTKHLYYVVDMGLCDVQDELMLKYNYIMDYKVLVKIQSSDLRHAIEVPLPGLLDSENKLEEEPQKITKTK